MLLKQFSYLHWWCINHVTKLSFIVEFSINLQVNKT